MTIQNVLSLENLVDVQAVLSAATRRVIEFSIRNALLVIDKEIK